MTPRADEREVHAAWASRNARENDMAESINDRRTITTSILGLASGPSRLFASLRPRSAGLAALTDPSVSPVLGIYVMARQTMFHGPTRSQERRTAMHATAITPSIGVTIGRQMRHFHAYVTTAPAVLDAPSTVTLYLATLSESLAWQRSRAHFKACVGLRTVSTDRSDSN